MKKLSILIFAMALLTSCGQNSKKTKSIQSIRSVNTHTIKEVLDYDMKDLLLQDTTCTKDILHCTHVRVSYPEFYGNHADQPNRATHNLITYLLYDKDMGSRRSLDLKKVAKDFIFDYYLFKRSFPQVKTTWFFRLKSEPVYEQDSLLCFSFVAEQQKGKDHGLSGKYFLTFNRYTGKRFSPLHLISDKKKFLDLVEQKFRTMKKLTKSEDLKQAGFHFSGNQFALPSNIGLNDTGFIVRYNVYEIAPYPSGPTELIIPYNEAGVKHH